MKKLFWITLLSLVIASLFSACEESDGKSYYMIEIRKPLVGMSLDVVCMEVEREGSADDIFSEYLKSLLTESGATLPEGFTYAVNKASNREKLVSQYHDLLAEGKSVLYVHANNDGFTPEEPAAPQE